MLTIFFRHKILDQAIKSVTIVSSRCLNLLEYQSKNLLKSNGLTIQDYILVKETPVEKEFRDFHADEYVVKAQILAGGRGKGVFDNGFKGGVRLTKDKATAMKYVEQMLGNRLITKQTPKAGILVKSVMVARSVDIVKETYVCLLMDRQCNGPIIMASPEGGVDIETVASKRPHQIKKLPIDMDEGLTEAMAVDICNFLRFKRDLKSKVVRELQNLWKMFLKVDAVQIEVNPLAATNTDEVVCIDAKLNFDDNARFRQRHIFDMEDLSGQDPNEVHAAKHQLNYIRMNGNIGCLVNGAGLAMATMDIIKLFGGEPANFLDIGGGVTSDQIREAFKILISDKKVEVILVNVFGGIVNCEIIAKGICEIAEHLTIPTVVRLEGTSADAGLKLLKDSGSCIETAVDFEDAARKAVEIVKCKF